MPTRDQIAADRADIICPAEHRTDTSGPCQKCRAYIATAFKRAPIGARHELIYRTDCLFCCPEGVAAVLARLYANNQQITAPRRKADGQCLACGAFRTDGRPPTVHLRGCPGFP